LEKPGFKPRNNSILEKLAEAITTAGMTDEVIDILIQVADTDFDVIDLLSRLGGANSRYASEVCQLFYEISTKEGFCKTFQEFNEIIGAQYLRAMHLNDSKKELGSRVDRHESIGDGEIGIDTFIFIMQDEQFDDIPMILETPNTERWAEEIEMLYSFASENVDAE
jgi:hypothetical protein